MEFDSDGDRQAGSGTTSGGNGGIDVTGNDPRFGGPPNDTRPHILRLCPRSVGDGGQTQSPGGAECGTIVARNDTIFQ